MPRGDLVVGVDCSTTAAKAVVWSPTGTVLSQARSTFELTHPRPNYAEQNPEDWWTATRTAIRRAVQTVDRERIAALYDGLAQLAPSPVVELNRAVALAMAFGPAAGLEVADTLVDETALRNYHLLPSVRGDFLFKLGRLQEARAEFLRAAELTQNERERTLLLSRASACQALPAGRDRAN